jgi:NAD(P)H-hydrate repair Nnr-like enzyme with NAD(P)H-hydrate epimerase domain
MTDKRSEQVGFTFWVEAEVRDAIKRIATDRGVSVQSLMEEAAKDLIAKYTQKSNLNTSATVAPTHPRK